MLALLLLKPALELFIEPEAILLLPIADDVWVPADCPIKGGVAPPVTGVEWLTLFVLKPEAVLLEEPEVILLLLPIPNDVWVPAACPIKGGVAPPAVGVTLLTLLVLNPEAVLIKEPEGLLLLPLPGDVWLLADNPYKGDFVAVIVDPATAEVTLLPLLGLKTVPLLFTDPEEILLSPGLLDPDRCKAPITRARASAMGMVGTLVDDTPD